MKSYILPFILLFGFSFADNIHSAEKDEVKDNKAERVETRKGNSEYKSNNYVSVNKNAVPILCG